MAAGRRVLVSGMGGDLGSRVAALLEHEDWVGELVGIDVDPPRRRLHRGRRSTSSRPVEHDRIVETITAFNPHVVVHISVWEPHSRANPTTARQLTDDAATSILGAAAECRALESVDRPQRHRGLRPGARRADPARRVGRRRPDVRLRRDAGRHRAHGRGHRPAGRRHASARSAWAPCSARTCRARSGGCCACRPCRSACSPTRRSPSSRTSSSPGRSSPPPERRLAEPVNVVANGAITALQAARRGRRIPVPLVGPDWAIARAISGLLGRADPRPRGRDDAPRPAGRQRADGRAARLPLDDDDDGRDRRAVRVADRASATPARRGGGVMARRTVTDTGYEARVITLPGRADADRGPQDGGDGGGPPGRRRRRLARRRLGSRPARSSTRSVGSPRLRWSTVDRRRRSAARARRRADRRQRPPLRPGPVHAALAHRPRRPGARCASSAGPTSRRSAPSPAVSAACSPAPTRSPARCGPASCS